MSGIQTAIIFFRIPDRVTAGEASQHIRPCIKDDTVYHGIDKTDKGDSRRCWQRFHGLSSLISSPAAASNGIVKRAKNEPSGQLRRRRLIKVFTCS